MRQDSITDIGEVMPLKHPSPVQSSPLAIHLGRLILDGRIARGWSQHDLAQRIGVSRVMVSRYECGKDLPKLLVYAELCRVFDLDPRALLLGPVLAGAPCESLLSCEAPPS